MNEYQKGQVFPFLIAVIVVFVAIALVTLNLGQIGIFKTDVSNAADAGALSGASVLSSTLLGLGLKSDMMSGRAAEAIVTSVLTMVIGGFPIGVVLGVIMIVVFIIEQIIELMMAMGDANMGWTNAKKTAVQYAFNNMTVDEPQPTFDDFLKNAYNLKASNLNAVQLRQYYDEYMNGTTEKAVRYARSNFSQFMQDIHSGYWKVNSFGRIEPSDYSEAEINSGYGWNDKTSGGGNSYPAGDYKNYDNWVEVKVVGATTYGIQGYSWVANIASCINDFILDNIWIAWFLGWLVGWQNLLTSMIINLFISASGDILLMTGIDFASSTADQTDNNPLVVQVTRYKKEKDMGIWKMKFGPGVQATASAHAFREHYDNNDADRNYRIEETIRPQFDPGKIITNILGCTDAGWDFFDTKRHLFETKLKHAF